jgi:NADH-quinone oxidoreductase subunit G
VRLNRARLYIANSEAHQAGAAGQGHAAACRRTATQPRRFLDARRIRFQQGSPGRGIAGRHLRQEFRGEAVESLVAWGLKRGNVRFAYLGDHANSRGAADMGLFPDLLPGYVRSPRPAHSRSIRACPRARQNAAEIFDAAGKGELGALLVVGANPVASAVDPAALKNTFVIVQDIFLTETAALADVVFPPPVSTKNPAP